MSCFTQPNGWSNIVNGERISEGFHEKFGDHAEIVALKNCKESTAGATLYVTLEPCCHQVKLLHGQKQSSRQELKVVIASLDPSDKVNGKV